MRIRTRLGRFAALGALALVAAACSGEDETGGVDTTPIAAAPETSAAGADTTAAAGADTTVAAGSDTTAAPAETTPAPSGAGTLADVVARGTLICGVNDAVPGFGFVDEAGNFSGFDIDLCRVIAAAILGDATAVEFRPLTTEQRFPALQSGEVDVLSRNTTWTSSRDGTEGLDFAVTTYYDGQGMMVRAADGFTTLEDMAGTTICVLSGTTTELNLETRFATGGIEYTPLPFEDNDTLQPAFVEERCDGWTSDRSQLAGVRSNFPADAGGPESLVILEEVFSKEPLGPVVREGDPDFLDAINWAIYATITAEELGIDSTNVGDQASSSDLSVIRLLGLPNPEDQTVFDPGLGLPTDFVVQVVSQVGNYGEIFERNVGAGSPLGLERGLNALWSDGGLIYAPPFR